MTLFLKRGPDDVARAHPYPPLRLEIIPKVHTLEKWHCSPSPAGDLINLTIGRSVENAASDRTGPKPHSSGDAVCFQDSRIADSISQDSQIAEAADAACCQDSRAAESRTQDSQTADAAEAVESRSQDSQITDAAEVAEPFQKRREPPRRLVVKRIES